MVQPIDDKFLFYFYASVLVNISFINNKQFIWGDILHIINEMNEPTMGNPIVPMKKEQLYFLEFYKLQL